MPEPTESRITRLLGDRYELIELLGKGGFAGVYRVRNLRLQRTEALKVLSETLTEDPEFSKRFEQEARVVAALDHPNIVKIYDYGAIEDFFWFSMQFVDGLSVGRQLKSREHLGDAAAARIAVGVLDALQYSHARGVIHRDIKPDNILLDREGRPYLTDFGVAKSQMGLVKTHAGALLGSPAYMSPEQLQGKPLDGRSDLYSVGVTIYKMLSGGLPFTGEDTFRATMKRLSENPEPIVVRRPDLHPSMAEIVMRALEREPEERYPDALTMREDLEGFLAEITPARPRLSSPTRRTDDASPTQTVTPTPRPTRTTATTGTDAIVTSASAARLLTPTGLSPAPAPPASAGSAGPARLRRLGWIALSIAIGALVIAAIISRRAAGPAAVPARPTPAPKSPSAAPTAVPMPRGAIESSRAREAAPAPPPPKEALPEKKEKAKARPAAAATRPARRGALAATSLPVPTAAPTQAPAPASVGKRTPPEIVEQAPLLLSPAVLAAHHNESIGMVLIIAADGSLKSARVISSVCPECDRAALDAVRRFRFRAATDAKGNPIEGSFGFSIRVP